MRKNSVVIGDDSPVCALPQKTEFLIIDGPKCAQCQEQCIEGATAPFNVWMWKVRISDENRESLDKRYGCGSREGWVVESDYENIYIHIK
jgi:hypothetical protein